MRALLAALVLALALAPAGGAVLDPRFAALEEPFADCYSLNGERESRGPTLRGDVDGDGRADVVRTRAHWLNEHRCRAWLVVRTEAGRLRVAVEPAGSGSLLLAPPGLAGLVRLDRRRGLEIAVVPDSGASTTFVDVYRLRGERLRRLEGRTFAHGGSVANRSGVDCARKGRAVLVSTSATFRPSAGRYVVVRRFHAIRHGAFQLRPTLTERYRLREQALPRFPELADQIQPFPSCAAVR